MTLLHILEPVAQSRRRQLPASPLGEQLNMPTGNKPVPKDTQNERRREIKAICSTASHAIRHFVNREGNLVTSIPVGSEEIRRLARLEHSAKKRKVRRNRANQIFAELSTPRNARGLLSEDHLAARWLCSKSRLQKWRSAGRGPAYLKSGRRVLYRLADIDDFERDRLVCPAVDKVR